MEKVLKKEAHFIQKIIPGLLLCILIMFGGLWGAELIGSGLISIGFLSEGSKTPVSGIFVGIILGIIIRNIIGFSEVFAKGISFSMKFVLRAGIILLGLRLSLLEALKLGAFGIPLIIACISVGLFVTLFLANKLNQSMRLATLIASGTSICGITAIMATSPVIKARENEISYAVANVTVFGLTAMLLYPFLANLLFTNDVIKAGLFLGTAIHDTAQVAGAALIYDQIFQTQQVLETATVTKLTRNLFIIAIIPFMSYLFYKNSKSEANLIKGEKEELPKWYTFIPVFVIGFLLLSVLRTIGDATAGNIGSAFGIFSPENWERFYSGASSFGTTYLLGIAMAGVGLSTNFKNFKGLGLKPFYIGFAAAVSVGFVSASLVWMFGDLVQL